MNNYREKDRQTLFIDRKDPSGHCQGFSKRISQLRDITVNNKNKIQYNSA